MSQRFAWYLAALQLIFTLCWTVYVIYLQKLAAAAGIAQDLGQMVAAQLAAGAAWGAILMSAFTVAFAVGANGGEGRMAGLLFSALALATLTCMAAGRPGSMPIRRSRPCCNGRRSYAGRWPARPCCIWLSPARGAGHIRSGEPSLPCKGEGQGGGQRRPETPTRPPSLRYGGRPPPFRGR